MVIHTNNKISIVFANEKHFEFFVRKFQKQFPDYKDFFEIGEIVFEIKEWKLLFKSFVIH